MAKAAYFKDQLKEITTTKAYWNLLPNATKPKVRKPIGPIRLEDKSISVEDSEKVNLVNEYFASLGKRLAAGYAQLPATTANNPALVPQISNVSLSTDVIKKILNAKKSGKSTGPDNVSPKLLKLAGPSIVSALHSLYTRSLQECKVFKDWKLARLSPIFKKDDELEMGNYLSPECT